MARESLIDPIPEEALKRARARLAYDGKSVEQWANENGFTGSAKVAHDILGGRRKAIRGVSLCIAIKLGLRPDPTHPAPSAGLSEVAPAARTEEPPEDATRSPQ